MSFATIAEFTLAAASNADACATSKAIWASVAAACAMSFATIAKFTLAAASNADACATSKAICASVAAACAVSFAAIAAFSSAAASNAAACAASETSRSAWTWLAWVLAMAASDRATSFAAKAMLACSCASTCKVFNSDPSKTSLPTLPTAVSIPAPAPMETPFAPST